MRRILVCALVLTGLASGGGAHAELRPHAAVRGEEVRTVRLVQDPPQDVEWGAPSVSSFLRKRGSLVLRTPPGAAAIELPACTGTLQARVDRGLARGLDRRPTVIDLPADGAPHEVTLDVTLSRYEGRLACGAAPRAGARAETVDGLGELTFASVHAREGGGKAVVFLPVGHDAKRPSALLVGLHPWGGNAWTYAAYGELLAEAQAKDVVLLFPSGLGNSLYTEQAEGEALDAIDALAREVAVDRARVSLWGASMGGAGATTIGFHHPDRFAAITSFFGDSRYDLSTYVRAILGDEAGAHRVNALDVVDNARNVPVWLVHGEDDRVSPIAQSEMLADALRARSFPVRFDRVPGMGHEGGLVARFIAEVVDRAAAARVAEAPRRVSFTSVGPRDASVYGVRLVRGGARGDATIDLERRGDAVHVLRARGLRSILLPRGAFGAAPEQALPILIDDPSARGVAVRWDALP